MMSNFAGAPPRASEVPRQGHLLPLADGRAVQLVREGGGYKIAALE